MLPSEITEIESLTRWLAPGTTVGVTQSEGVALDVVVTAALSIQSAGFRARPTVSARELRSERELRDALTRLRLADVDEICLVAGRAVNPLGPYANSLEILDSGILQDHDTLSIAVAGHPEGSKHAEQADLWDALRRKQHYGFRTGSAVKVISQFALNPRALELWERNLRQHAITLRIAAGIPGPGSTPRAVHYAMQCGIPLPLGGFGEVRDWPALASGSAITPAQVLTAVVRYCANTPDTRVDGVHVYTFGQALATARWLHDIASGDFEMAAGDWQFTPRCDADAVGSGE